MAFVHASQNQQQGYPNQYPPPPPQGAFGAPFGADGQKEHHGYDQQQHNGQYNPQYNDQYNQQYNGQYGSQQYNTPQYPPTAYDQGNPSQPVSAVPVPNLSSFSSLSCRRHRIIVTQPHLALLLLTTDQIASLVKTWYSLPPSSTKTLYTLCLGIHDLTDATIYTWRESDEREGNNVRYDH